MFLGDAITRARRGRDAILEHPHRPALDRVFADMQELSRAAGFEVIVVIAPTAVRLYAEDFVEFPAIAERSYLSDHIAELSAASGFEHIDLFEPMHARARNEMFYFLDDDHWNQAGHALVADLVVARAFVGEAP
jgi:hypothetical protein